MTPSKQEACEIFLAAVHEAAVKVGRQIASKVSANGKATTLTDDSGLAIFSGEWSLARLAWLSRRVADLADPELQACLSSLIGRDVEELSDLLCRTDPMAYPNYWVLAGAYDGGGRSPLGSPMGPGPVIAHRYRSNLEKLKPDERLDPEEMFLIIALGDACCWSLGCDINQGLQDILDALNEDDRC